MKAALERTSSFQSTLSRGNSGAKELMSSLQHAASGDFQEASGQEPQLAFLGSDYSRRQIAARHKIVGLSLSRGHHSDAWDYMHCKYYTRLYRGGGPLVRPISYGG